VRSATYSDANRDVREMIMAGHATRLITKSFPWLRRQARPSCRSIVHTRLIGQRFTWDVGGSAAQHRTVAHQAPTQPVLYERGALEGAPVGHTVGA
jgi:hypothetical protein